MKEEAKKIVICGQGKVGKGVMDMLESKGIECIIIGDANETENTIAVNGVKYREKEKQQRKPMSTPLIAALMLAQGYSHILGGSDQKSTPNVDIVKEYGLIQQKKSLLSKSERDWVVDQFNRKYEQI